jgi:hypothetical protein
VIGNAKVEHGWRKTMVKRVMRGEPFLVLPFDSDIDMRLHSKISTNSKINHVCGYLGIGRLTGLQLILDKSWR